MKQAENAKKNASDLPYEAGGGKSKRNMNRQYHLRFLLRVAVFLAAVLIYVWDREEYDVLFHHFFEKITPLHLIWFFLLLEMLMQAVPLPFMPTGCMKQFPFRYEPVSEKTRAAQQELLKTYRNNQNLRAFLVLILWCIGNSFWWILYKTGLFTEAECFLGTMLYTVFDLICILWFCPFQFLMNTRCCSTCRIFNYGQIFTVTPILLVPSFASLSLIAVAWFILLQWELRWFFQTERFYEGTNARLTCAHCDEKLCLSRNRMLRRLHLPHPGTQNKRKKTDLQKDNTEKKIKN